jgi:SAM-dependent methyltransferase
LVVEIASNDGYLLQYFKEQGIPVLGVEPARNVAQVAIDAGIDTLTEFFGVALARRLSDERRRCDLLVGNNVLAHVPDLNDFVAGLGILLADDGVLSMEFPHLLQLVEHTQFDTIYHEHFSYFSLLAVQRIFGHHDLEIFDVEELSSHGGSLRVYAQHAHGEHPASWPRSAVRVSIYWRLMRSSPNRSSR